MLGTIADLIEDIWLVEMMEVKLAKFRKNKDTDSLERLALRLVMRLIPFNPVTINIAERILKDALVLYIDNEIAIAMWRVAGTSHGTRTKLAGLETCCLYRVPRLYGNYLVFECFDV